MKPERMIPETEARELLKACTWGTLSMVTPDGMPYGVPINYHYDEAANALYFHCGPEGKKMDCLEQKPEVSLAVVKDPVLVEERFTTHYESVIVTGWAEVLSDPDERRSALTAFCMALAPKGGYRMQEVIDKHWDAVTMVKITIETVEGKRNRDV
jgi:nitroimidazol reductase NimA-like FMN-containing flavoprotein (pyridoxamine 5'-phosphate oxidase superfamily)